MTRIGVETQNSHGKSFVLVVPDVFVYDPVMSDNLIPVGCLIKGGVTVNHRIPVQANEDGLSLKAFPLYGGTITTPDKKTIIVMEYAQHSWHLYRLCNLPELHVFGGIQHPSLLQEALTNLKL